MRILVVGSGGREHAIVWKLAHQGAEVFCAPGNAGIGQQATLVPLSATDIDGLLAFAREKRIDLTIVGPEQPLILGITDRFREAGLAICGPTAAAANAEGSKAWFKQVLKRHGLPTPDFRVFSDKREAYRYIAERGVENIVIKADGLMGGKGVFLPDTLAEAQTALMRLMIPDSPGETVVIEDREVGPELSLTGVTDGATVYSFPVTRDHKRLREYDRGPNTGGMGAYTVELEREGYSHAHLTELSSLSERTIEALAREGVLYSGICYLGVMMTPSGPKILEMNCRFGDPESQALLPSVSCDLADLCMRAAVGGLSAVPSPVQHAHALCVVLASGEYPGSSDRDDPIVGLKPARDAGARVYHAGTAQRADGGYTTNKSGRVVGVTGVASTQEEARVIAYAGVKQISFPDMQCRWDIGLRRVTT